MRDIYQEKYSYKTETIVPIDDITWIFVCINSEVFLASLRRKENFI